MAITRASGGNRTMLSNQHGIGDSNQTETDRAGRLGDRSAPAVSCGHLFTQVKRKKIYSSIVIMVSI